MNSKRLFIVVGQPASGKTTFAEALAEKRGAGFFDIDTTSETLVRAALTAADRDPDDRDSAYFKSNFREPIYRTLFELAQANLANLDVVISGPFTKEFTLPQWLESIQSRYGFVQRPIAIHTHCSPALLEQRMRMRNNPRDRAKLADWTRHLTYYEAAPRPLFPHISVDTGIPEHVESALTTLGKSSLGKES